MNFEDFNLNDIIQRSFIDITWRIDFMEYCKHLFGNDFYIGTLRTNKYSRRGINGTDKKVSEEKDYRFLYFRKGDTVIQNINCPQDISNTENLSHYHT